MLAVLYAPCCPAPAFSTIPIAAEPAFYFAIVDTFTQDILFDGFYSR